MEFYINKKPVIIFVCHDNNSIEMIYEYVEKYDIVYAVIVGNKEIDEKYTNNKEKVLIAKSYKDNIESEEKLLTFTAWYLIIKNNLFKYREYICVCEYDVILKDGFIHTLNELCVSNAHNVISFFSTYHNFMFDINKNVLENFLIKKKIEEYPINRNWNPTTNHCMRRSIMEKFVDWYYPDCMQIKKEDEQKLSFYHERLFSVFLYSEKIDFFYMYNMMTHIEHRSHISIPNDFNWQTYIKLNITAVHPITRNPLITEEDAIRHYKIYGYFDNLPYKEKRYGLIYDDETGVYNNYINQLKYTMEIYGDLEVIIYKKSQINDKFKEKYSSILNEKRGDGYWLWKPYIISDTLKKIEENATLFYIDYLYYFTERFDILYEDIDKTHIQVWENKPNEPTNILKNWCKIDVLTKYNVLKDSDTIQDCWAGSIMLKNSYKTKNLINTWLAMCCNYDNITDSPSKNNEPENFIEHRHDQSLLSIILYKNNIKLSHWHNRYLQNVRFPW